MARFPHSLSWLSWLLGTGAAAAGLAVVVGAITPNSSDQWIGDSPDSSGLSTSVWTSTISSAGSFPSQGEAQFGASKARTGDRSVLTKSSTAKFAGANAGRSRVVRLENGLTVVTRPVATAPVVSVQVWYRVGTRNETLMDSGLAHTLEHLLFKGTRSRPVQFGWLFSALGSESNASTGYDSTAFVNTAGRGQLEALLTLEADRMTGAALTGAALEQERSVVLSELAGYGNEPAYRLDAAVMARAFPGRAIAQPIGGTAAGVTTLDIETLRHHYRRFYRPDNAVLTIVGDFDESQAFSLVRRLFGNIQPWGIDLDERSVGIAQTVSRQVTQGKQALGKKTLEEQAVANPELPEGEGTVTNPLRLQGFNGVPLLQLVYPMPEAGHGDEAALLVLSRVLATGRRSLLNQTLVDSEEPLAGTVDGLLFHGVDRGWYQLVIEGLAEVPLKSLQRRVLATVEQVRGGRVNREALERAKVLVRSQMLLDERDVTSQGMRLGQDCLILADCNYRDRLLGALDQVTPADVQRVARKYLAADQVTVGWLEASGDSVAVDAGWDEGPGWNRRSRVQRFHHGDHASVSEETAEPQTVAALVKQYLPRSNAVDEKSDDTAIAPEVVTLPNGLEVLLVRDDSTPTVTVAGYVPAGRQWDPVERAGLAELVASGLWAGSGDRSEAALTQALESRGIELNFHAHREGVAISGQALADQEQDLVRLLGDLLQRPRFEASALDRDRQQALTTLKNRLDTPSYVARKRAQQLMYPAGHPFRTFATAETLQVIARQDVQKFYQQHYRPNGTVLAIIGDIDPGRLRQVIGETFGEWQRSPAPQIKTQQPQRPNKLQHIYRAIAAKSQAITVMGYPGITRTDPRYYPALVLNQILGGDTLASRLGRTLRDRHGLTYGIYSQFQTGQTAGPFSIDFQTAPQDVNTAIQLVRKELGTLRRSGVTAAEVTAAQQALVRSYPVTLADPDILAEHLVMEWVHGLPPGELAKFGDRINSVTVAQVNQVIQQLIEPDRLAIVTAGPPKAAKFSGR
ncbi:MAG: pitrilysin family protein [Cyanobacteria bacterium P01_D01_bin.73]